MWLWVRAIHCLLLSRETQHSTGHSPTSLPYNRSIVMHSFDWSAMEACYIQRCFISLVSPPFNKWITTTTTTTTTPNKTKVFTGLVKLLKSTLEWGVKFWAPRHQDIPDLFGCISKVTEIIWVIRSLTRPGRKTGWMWSFSVFWHNKTQTTRFYEPYPLSVGLICLHLFESGCACYQMLIFLVDV